MQVEALHDMPVAVPSLMEKFLLDLGIMCMSCKYQGEGRGEGSTAIHTYYIHTVIFFICSAI